MRLQKKNTRTEGARTCSTCAEWRVNASEHAAYSSSYCWHFFCHCSLCISTWTCSLHRTHVLYSSKNDVRKAVEKKKHRSLFFLPLVYVSCTVCKYVYIYKGWLTLAMGMFDFDMGIGSRHVVTWWLKEMEIFCMGCACMGCACIDLIYDICIIYIYVCIIYICIIRIYIYIYHIHM